MLHVRNSLTVSPTYIDDIDSMRIHFGTVWFYVLDVLDGPLCGDIRVNFAQSDRVLGARAICKASTAGSSNTSLVWNVDIQSQC